MGTGSEVGRHGLRLDVGLALGCQLGANAVDFPHGLIFQIQRQSCQRKSINSGDYFRKRVNETERSSKFSRKLNALTLNEKRRKNPVIINSAKEFGRSGTTDNG